MDINSLLSPQESNASSNSNSQPGRSVSGATPASAPTGPQKPIRRGGRANSGRTGMTSSPLAQHVLAPPAVPEPSPPMSSPSISGGGGGGGGGSGGERGGSGGGSGAGSSGTPPANEQPASRQPSTPGMDTLADLASMQHHQPPRTNTSLLRGESYESQLSPSTMFPNVNPIAHNTPTPRTSFDIAMSDGPKEGTATRNYTNTSLDSNSQQLAMQLFQQIQENSESYDAHVNFIRLLHAGFVNHVYPPNNPDIQGDPRQYDLLKDMRTAREEMDKLFALGENLWAEWIQDESMLATNVDERISVMDLCQRSVEEEYGSTKLWSIYGEWVLYLYNSANGISGHTQWSEEDKMIGREVFNFQLVLGVWQRGAEATRFRIHDSHLVWDRFLELLLQDLSVNPSAEKLAHVRGFFDLRLQTPHATWDQTFQTFSSFVSNYYNSNYEDIMSDTVARSSEAKNKYRVREDFEIRLRNAAEAGDVAQEWIIYSEYIGWELSRSRQRRHFSFDLANAVYQRVVLRFPTDSNTWEDYVMFLIDESMHDNTDTTTLSTLDRATRHCPSSGTLWSQYLLSSEREMQSFSKIADIKHKATSTGLLDVGGMEEVLKVHTTWCSYLRRRAFTSDATDEDVDVAEVGIRSAIEDVQDLGEKKYGRQYQGDPLFRLERIYIRYLSESGSWDSARETFKGLVSRRGNSYEFWLTYYSWELISWSKFVQGDATADAARRTPNPSFATAVLKQAVKRNDLDWPEKIMQTYIAHCEDYEDSDELQLAMLETRKAMRAVTARREREASELAAQQQQQQQAQAQAQAQQQVAQPAVVAAESSPSPEKRKREDEAETNGMPEQKKVRADEPLPSVMETDEPLPARRDRENATVIVKNLPHGCTEHRVRQFFRHCGNITGVQMLPGEDKKSEVAMIEFETKDEALVAQTRDQKTIDDNTISVQLGSGSTLFVTNFPPEADEKYIRDLFREHGEIVDIRFPSLKYNTHRRFCYVQFRDPGQAYSATQLDGHTVGTDLQLVAKISDPTHKQDRRGPMYEGREIHVSNIDWKASENDLKELFSQYGTVETVRIPRKVDGGSRGFGYVVFSSKDEANAALAVHQQEFRSRPLQVKVSSPQGAKRSATTIVSHIGRSRSPSMELNGKNQSHDTAEGSTGERENRTLGLMNVPDTVNDARIRAMAKPFGSLIKVVLRPDHQGAIVEYADVHAAGKASLGLEGQEIVPGRSLRVGTVPEMLKQSAEKKTNNPPKEKSSSLLAPSGPIRRPQQPGRGGKRGGLGVKRTAEGSSGGNVTKATTTTTTTEGEGESTKKSNDDFRAMIQGNKPQ